MIVDEFDLTQGVITIGGFGPVLQPLDAAFDVTGYRRLDLVLSVVEMTIDPTAEYPLGSHIAILSGQQTESDSGWSLLTSFGSITGGRAQGEDVFTAPLTIRRCIECGLQRFIRWSIPSLSLGGNSTFSFSIRGFAHEL